MAKLILRATEKNRLFAQHLVAHQNIKYNVTVDGLELTGERITITRELANKHLGLDKLDPNDATVRWRSLIINREGSLLSATDDLIILADDEEKSQWSSVRVRRDTKEFGEDWSNRMGISQAQFYEEAVHHYVKQFLDGNSQDTN